MCARHRISLDGSWQFHFDAQGQATLTDLATCSPWRDATVPMPWQAQFPDLRNRGGIGRYRRTVKMDAIAPERAAILHFGAVDYHATVWLNGHWVCEHEGGYLPFQADVAHLLVVGDNELIVRAIDPDDDRAPGMAFQFSQIPHGKQSWYGQTSGIWQRVWLETRAKDHVHHLRLTPHPDQSAIVVHAPLAHRATLDTSLTVKLTVLDPDGAVMIQQRVEAERADNAEYTLQLDPAQIKRWSPDHPALYTVRAVLHRGGHIVDEIADTCGFRTIEARDGRLHLNGRPLYLRGALDQAYYPESIYTPPNIQFLEAQLRRAKELGFNCLRCHIKIEDPRYYALADRMGMLIWAELPNWMHLSSAAAARAETTFAGMVARDWNHPSIIAWTIINEDWGTDLVNDDSHRRWLVDFYNRAKTLDPTRLVVDNSPCHPNAHVISDIEDYHHYRVIPDHAADWDAWVADFAARPAWVWSPDYAHLRRPDAPLIVSEFGNWGLPDPRRLQEKGKQPWWFDAGYDWGEGVATPAGLEARFAGWRLDRVFGSFDAFIRASQEQMARSLAYEITSMRKQPAIGGYVITELADVHWEANGLMDFQRNVKAGVAEHVTPVNGAQAVLVEPSAWSVEPGQTTSVRLTAVDNTGLSSDGWLRWRTETAAGEIAAPGGVVEIPVAARAGSRLISVEVAWADETRLLATNQVELTCVDSSPNSASVFVNGADELAAALRDVGYRVVNDLQPDIAGLPIIVTTVFSADIQAHMRNGARVIFLADEEQLDNPANIALPLGEQTKILRRRETWWEGDWASSFSWLDKQGPFAHLPGGPILGLAYAELMPKVVLTIESHRLLKHNIWSGLAVGWLQRVVGLIASTDYGRGMLVISTFQLTPDIIIRNPLARGLLQGLINLAAAGDQDKVN